MNALCVAILAALAVSASAAPASFGDDPVQAAYWLACQPLLSNSVATSTSALDTGKLVANNGVWYLASYDKKWMTSTAGDPSGFTCANWTVAWDAVKSIATMTLNTNPPMKSLVLPFGLVQATSNPMVQTLQANSTTNPASITGLAFLQLDDNNAALVGCNYVATTPTPVTTLFWNVLTHNQTGAADSGAMSKITALTAKFPTLDTSAGNTANQNNQQCTAPAPSGATQITAMSGLVLAVVALFVSRS